MRYSEGHLSDSAARGYKAPPNGSMATFGPAAPDGFELEGTIVRPAGGEEGDRER